MNNNPQRDPDILSALNVIALIAVLGIAASLIATNIYNIYHPDTHLAFTFKDNVPDNNMIERVRGVFEKQSTGTTLVTVGQNERWLTFALASEEYDNGVQLKSGAITRITVGADRAVVLPRDQGRPYVLVTSPDGLDFSVCSSRKYSFARRLIDIVSQDQARWPEFICYSLEAQLHATPALSASY